MSPGQICAIKMHHQSGRVEAQHGWRRGGRQPEARRLASTGSKSGRCRLSFLSWLSALFLNIWSHLRKWRAPPRWSRRV